MSLILDALNRSDSDRGGSADTPGLHSVHGPRGEAPAPLWQRLAWPLLAVLFAVIALFMWWGSDEPEAPAAVAQPAPEISRPVPLEAAPQRAEATRRTVAPQPARSAPPPRENLAELQRPAPGFSDDVAALYSQMQAAGINPDEVPLEAPPEPEPARSSSQQLPAQSLAELQQMAMAAESGRAQQAEAEFESAPLAPAPAQSAAASATNPGYDVDALARAAQAELADRQRRSEPVVRHEAPFITDLRQAQKDQIPSIFYNQHNWSSNPGQRSVVLNGQEYREGQQLKAGLRLVEILEESIVLSFQGTEFQLQSLNSWVNL